METGNKKLRWGVLGTARIADEVIGGIKLSSNSVVTAVASRDGERASAWAAERGIPHAFGSYEEMLASSEIDAVYIPLPNALHVAWSVRAAEAGKHVLCEKPLSADPEEVEHLIDVADRAGVAAMEAFMYRFHPQTLKWRELIESGAIGKVQIVRATFGFVLTRPHDVRWSAALKGGSMMDVGCYCLNAARIAAGGGEVTRASASAQWAESGVDASLAGTLLFENGVLAAIDSSFAIGTRGQQWLSISGTEGKIDVPLPFRIPPDQSTYILLDKADGTPPEQIEIPPTNEYYCMVEHFAGAVLSGRKPSYSLRETLANTRTIAALLADARKR